MVVLAEERRSIFGGDARVLGRCTCLDVTPGLGEGPGQRASYGLDDAFAVAALQIFLRVGRGALWEGAIIGRAQCQRNKCKWCVCQRVQRRCRGGIGVLRVLTQGAQVAGSVEEGVYADNGKVNGKGWDGAARRSGEEEGKQRGWGCVHDSCGEDRARCLHSLDQTIEVRTRDRRTALRGLVRVRVRGCGVRDLRLGLEAPLCYVSGSRACGDGWCLRLVALT